MTDETNAVRYHIHESQRTAGRKPRDREESPYMHLVAMPRNYFKSGTITIGLIMKLVIMFCVCLDSEEVSRIARGSGVSGVSVVNEKLSAFKRSKPLS